MKFLAAVLILAAVASATSLEGFRSWAKSNNKLYTAVEEARRFAIFKENSAKAERANLEMPRAKFGVNKFADLTTEEFAAIYASGLRGGKKFVQHEVGTVNADEADYTYMLPAVKDQASCGSCWAFSAVANAEGQTYMKTKKVVSLSEQQLVSCDKMDSGCNGGSMVYADQYAVENGLASEKDYPYTSASGSVAKCKAFKAVAEFTSNKDFSTSGTMTDAKLLAALDQYGPLSVGIAASTMYFQLYSGGILDNVRSCGKNLDHGVTLVGYGTEDGVDYWNIRNSWGSSWGEKGYVKFIRGDDMCGVNEMVSTIIA